ncbi:integrase catalytic domain-containing protein [Trichonephila clavipes]|nr:integrase catalytic domain-containing protein [Trichonephila clavipes]
MTKAILRKTLGRAALDYEELITVFYDCERAINSRPLTYVSEDVDHVSLLTPEMFLREIPESEFPDIDTVDREVLPRVLKLIPGRDDHIRLVLIKTEHSEFLRPVQMLIRLEKDNPVGKVNGDVIRVCSTSSGRIVKTPKRV